MSELFTAYGFEKATAGSVVTNPAPMSLGLVTGSNTVTYATVDGSQAIQFGFDGAAQTALASRSVKLMRGWRDLKISLRFRVDTDAMANGEVINLVSIHKGTPCVARIALGKSGGVPRIKARLENTLTVGGVRNITTGTWFTLDITFTETSSSRTITAVYAGAATISATDAVGNPIGDLGAALSITVGATQFGMTSADDTPGASQDFSVDDLEVDVYPRSKNQRPDPVRNLSHGGIR